MGFEEFLPKEEEIIEEIPEKEVEKINQNQVYDVITSKKADWQVIIYDLIHTEQLDPWDIDIIILTRKYFEKIKEIDDTDFYISSKVLLAAALLLRIKSEFLLNKHIK
ncbi:segregation/condensation protein A, partial [Patescibacteria group bacterium]|nr:segregation/condensation protein A [Patescibacteria group bacterium]